MNKNERKKRFRLMIRNKLIRVNRFYSRGGNGMNQFKSQILTKIIRVYYTEFCRYRCPIFIDYYYVILPIRKITHIYR
ncbi:MAG: hypothetical protein ACI8ZM_001567 [Crocinitomix sp.]|jgi:hypothetical protein